MSFLREYGKQIAIGVGIVVVLILIIGLSVGLSGHKGADNESDIPEKFRIDCIPEGSNRVAINAENCNRRGCIFNPSHKDSNAPDCYMKAHVGYRLESGPTTLRSQSGVTDYTLKANGNGPYGEAIETVKFTVEEKTDYILRFKFSDDTRKRYEVKWDLATGDGPATDPKYEVEVTRENPFSFRVLRKTTKTVVFDTGVGGLVLSDRFLQIAVGLPSENIYGLGENAHTSFRHDLNFRRWPAFSRDEPPGEKRANLYGVHPFYECLEKDGNAHGVLLYNSNAMDYEFTPGPMLIFRTIGGVLDFYLFMGPTPENVIQQYTGAIGKPYMPPYWSLGFQLSRYGYKNTADQKAAVDRTVDNNIPLDVVHADIDYMDHERDFTLDPINYPDLPDYFAQLKADGIRNIIILDPCIEVNDTYEPYTLGREKDIFIKWPSRDVMPEGDYNETNSTAMLGYVWPDWKVVFPDFLLDEAEHYWEELVVKYKDTIDFDGLWLDMNEPANFGTNDEKPWNWPEDRTDLWSLKCPTSNWDDPPYATKAVYVHDEETRPARLSDKTLCMQAVQSKGEHKFYDVHSLFGHSQVIASLDPMRKALGDNKRGVMITRSSFPGTGHYAGHWLGDNTSKWPHLKESIIGMLEFNLFGIPYVGADICGYFQNTTVELCKRWMQLGAFYPFSRNHNGKDYIHQDPGYLGDEVVNAARVALDTRYSLLPFLYTLFHEVHINGGTVVRPLFHEFPTDQETWSIDTQFLWGPSLLISPILEEGQQRIRYYLPPGRWYDFSTGVGYGDEKGKHMEEDVTATSEVKLHIRGGKILPTQNPATNTKFSRLEPFGLYVALDNDDGEAEGTLFWDDGETKDTYEAGLYYEATFSCKQNALQHSVEHNEGGSMKGLTMAGIIIMGVTAATEVLLDGAAWGDFVYDSDAKVLRLNLLNLDMENEFEITWT